LIATSKTSIIGRKERGKSDMTVIAMTRQPGSLGSEVANGIAGRLGLKIIHSEIVANNVAERLGVE